MKRIAILVLAVSVLVPSFARAGFYLRPRGGAVFGIDGGDPAISVGGTLGYQFNSFLAAQASYMRLIGTGSAADGDEVLGEGVVSLPLKIITPYGSAGLGALHSSAPGAKNWSTLITFGGGITLAPILIFDVSLGFQYGIVTDGPDYIEPVASIGISF